MKKIDVNNSIQKALLKILKENPMQVDRQIKLMGHCGLDPIEMVDLLFEVEEGRGEDISSKRKSILFEEALSQLEISLLSEEELYDYVYGLYQKIKN